ncbi:MAG: hypothetical protein KKF98_00880 [Bacteroidetes bacterium]|nr:hypothetical protein [Bacteroidota bacterium]
MKIREIILLVILLAIASFTAKAQQYAQTYHVAGKHNSKISDYFTDYELDIKGAISVNDDDTKIISISPNGYLKISKKTFGNKRSLAVESSSKGNLTYSYYEGRKEVDFYPEGEKWLSEILIDVVRITGIDAEARTKRIYAKGGIRAFIDEVDKIPSNSVAGLYFRSLLCSNKLHQDETIMVLDAISRDISSNSERGKLYREFSGLFLENNAIASEYFMAISQLSSNSEMGSVLQSITHKIDFGSADIIETFFTCIDRMSSNVEASRVLIYTDGHQKLGDEAYVRLLQSVGKLSSNVEMGNILRTLQHLNLQNPNVSNAYFSTISGMSSNTESASVLMHTINNYELNSDNWIELLDVSGKLSSNTEMGKVLRTALHRMPFDKNEVDAFSSAARRMSSNVELSRVLTEMIHSPKFNKYVCEQLLSSARTMSSDVEKVKVLKEVSKTNFIQDQEIKKAYFSVAKTISSTSEYQDAMDVLLK